MLPRQIIQMRTLLMKTILKLRCWQKALKAVKTNTPDGKAAGLYLYAYVPLYDMTGTFIT